MENISKQISDEEIARFEALNQLHQNFREQNNKELEQKSLFQTDSILNPTSKKDEEEQKALFEFRPDVIDILEIEKLEGKKLYKELVESNKLCDLNSWKRILREVKDVNDDFYTLRTKIGVVSDTIGVLHYLLFPADGAMADQPLCGRIIIPRDYPFVPPVFHLLVPTGRYNVDAYYRYGDPKYLGAMHSSMCFDILKTKERGGIWEPQYTLSAIISSLLIAIVSTKVLQTNGKELLEFVNMEKLNQVHQSIETQYNKFKTFMPSKKEIQHIAAIPLRTKFFDFPEVIVGPKQKDIIVKSNEPIFLQVKKEKVRGNVYSVGFDLTELKLNPHTVFSVVLTNNPSDPLGREPDTVLVRNGVTATAAKKKAGKEIEWFYHGKPMNQDDLKLIVTIGYNQFCISYVDGDRKIIHGDCPVSFLTPAEIGRVNKQPFYLCVVIKNKRGPSITIKTFDPDYGYLHPVAPIDQKRSYLEVKEKI